MKLGNLFRRQSKEEENERYRNVSIEEALKMSHGKRMDQGENLTLEEQTKETSGLLEELRRRFADSKEEYGAVTSYLTDIQKLDMLPLDQRAKIEDASRQIMNLNKERGKYQQKEQQEFPKSYLAQYEDILPKEIQKLKEQEQYQNLVKEDLRQLEGERGSIQYEKELAERKREFIQRFSVGCCISVFLIFILLLYLSDKTKIDLNVPFFLTSFMTLFFVGYIVIGLRNTAYTIKYSDLKMNKLIQLNNKIKIKYVNITGLLDYEYEKYRVNSARELEKIWETYVRAKDEAERYRHNTQLLEFYHQELIDELKVADLQDPEIWIYQTDAILNENEMVEVRHRLNVRRQKLRETMDTLNSQIEQYNNQLSQIQKRHSESNTEVTVTQE